MSSKILKLSFLFAAVICLIPSCSKTTEGTETDGEVMVFKATMPDEETKTTLGTPSDGVYEVLWKTGDKISVNGTKSAALSDAYNGKRNAEFTVSGSISTPYKVLYPGTTSTNVIALPATQTYVTNSFDGAAAAAYGNATKIGEDYSVSLTHFCGVIRFALKGSATLTRMEINSLGSEKLHGNFTLATNESGFTGVFSGGTAGTLTYNCPVTLSGSDTHFYICLPAQTYASGLEALVYQSDGAFMRLKFWGSGYALDKDSVIEFESKTYAAGRTENLLQINSLTAENGGTPTVTPPSVTVAVYNLKQQENRASGTYAEYISMDRSDVKECMGYTIAGLEADIIGFNELSSDYLAGGEYDVKAMAGAGGLTTSNYGWYLNYPNKVDRSGTILNYSYSATMSYANGFAYNKNTLTLEEENYVWISQTENDYWSTKQNAYENSAGRHTCVWAKFTHKVSGKQFYFFVTHFATYIGESASNQQKNTYNTQSLETFARAKVNGALPIIVVGDLNYGPQEDDEPHGTTANYTTLTSYWTDAYVKIKDDGNMTSFYQKYCGTLSGSSHNYMYPWTSFTKDRPWRRLDYVLTKSGSSQTITPVEYRTVRRTYTAEDDEVRTASDHLPVVVKVAFN